MCEHLQLRPILGDSRELGPHRLASAAPAGKELDHHDLIPALRALYQPLIRLLILEHRDTPRRTHDSWQPSKGGAGGGRGGRAEREASGVARADCRAQQREEERAGRGSRAREHRLVEMQFALSINIIIRFDFGEEFLFDEDPRVLVAHQFGCSYIV